MTVQEAYCAGRGELAAHLLETLKDVPLIETAVQRFFWTPAYCGEHGRPQWFFQPHGRKYRADVIGFETRPLGIEPVGNDYLRLQVTTNWYLKLNEFRDIEDYFAKLSPKTRKKTRWLQNTYAKEGVRFEPIRTERDLEVFITIFSSQWPDSEWCGTLKPALFRIVLELDRLGRSASCIVRDAQGNPAAAALGYRTGRAYNLSMLPRCDSSLDRLSPGFFLVFWLIKQFLSGGERPDLFVFGPGEFNYKKTFLAEPLPIYRYETRSWRNIGGILNLYWRLRKERRKAAKSDP